MWSTEAIENLHVKLEAISCDENHDWETHTSLFFSILEDLVGQNQNLIDAENMIKLLRTLPHSSDALTMASYWSNNFFDQIADAVQAKIERRTKLETWNKEKGSNTAFHSVAQRPCS